MSALGLTRISGALAAICVLISVATMPAAAHHSAAPFDLTKNLKLRGTVERWQWANPHAWLYMRVEKADGTSEIWGLEAGSTGALAHNGWRASAMKQGDKVSVTVHPARNGQRVGLLSRVELPNGQALTQGYGGPPPGADTAPPRR